MPQQSLPIQKKDEIDQPIPCGHHICFQCARRVIQKNRYFRCQTCLSDFILEEEVNNLNRNINQLKEIKFYCIQCQESFSFLQFKGGVHKNHSIDRLEKLLPLIKQKALEKLNKGLVVENLILQNIQKEVDKPFFKQTVQLMSEIRSYFQRQRQILLESQKKIIQQVRDIQTKIALLEEFKRSKFIELYDQLHGINSILEDFISGAVEFNIIDEISVLKMAKQDEFMAKIKHIQKQTIDIPKFICVSQTNQRSYTNCLLKYSKQQLSESTIEDQSRLLSKKVNLRSKIARKMNCL